MATFVDFELTVDSDVIDQLIELYVNSNLNPESVSLFNSQLETNGAKSALVAAIINHQVVEALKSYI